MLGQASLLAVIAFAASTVALNPARVSPQLGGSAELDAVRDRLGSSTPGGLAGLAALIA